LEKQLKRLSDWLRNEAEERMKKARSRRAESSSCRNSTVAQLRFAKILAESMAGHKLTHVGTSQKDSVAYADLQDRISSKLEAESIQLEKWADIVSKVVMVGGGE
jgi:hypothetical protein